VKYDTLQSPVWNNIFQLNGSLYCGCIRNQKREIRASKCQQDWAVSYVIAGGGYIELAGIRHELKPGMICQRIPGIEYRLEFYGNMEQERYFIGMPRAAYELLRLVKPDLPESPVMEIGINQELINRLQLFIRKYSSDNNFSWQLTAGLIELAGMMLNPNKLLQPDIDQRIAHALKLLDDPALLHVSLQEISRRAGLGYNNFRKIFVLETGVSPGEYRLEKRIDFARQMLSNGMTQQETADALGYSDIYAFARQFKQRAKITPGEFIRNHAG